MAKKLNSILEKALQKVNPSKEETEKINSYLDDFIKKFDKEIKQEKIQAEVFLGGSYAKKTLVKKDKYDIDIFLRFGEKYKNESISEITEKILKSLKLKYKTLKGSRDYFQIKIQEDLFFELIPVLKTKTPEKAENITDLSYMHVQYVRKKIKSEKILNDIKIAKSFCYAQKSYGAESYINGFSGYALELLIYHYKGFLKFVKEIAKSNLDEKSEKRIVIDIEKKHKNKKSVLLDINESKLQSPIILIDPTYKYRNVLAALSFETFFKFQNSCKKFLKNPSLDFFEREKIDFEKLKKQAEKKNYDFVLLKAHTNKQSGDIAGSKLKKFYRHLKNEIKKYFDIKEKKFEYSENKNAKFFFSAKPKKKILIQGPWLKDKKNFKEFEKSHKNKNEKLIKKSGRIYSEMKINFSLKEFVSSWKKSNKTKMKDMGVTGFSVN